MMLKRPVVSVPRHRFAVKHLRIVPGIAVKKIGDVVGTAKHGRGVVDAGVGKAPSLHVAMRAVGGLVFRQHQVAVLIGRERQ